MATVQKINPSLWFHTEALEAVQFYTTIFKNSSIKQINYMNQSNESSNENVVSISFQLEGQDFVAINGRGSESFTQAISFIVNCRNQDEIDYYWVKLTEGTDENAQMCGWLKDRFGVSWQVVPDNLSQLLSDPDPERVKRVMDVMLKMKKLDMNALLKAYDGK